jgi:hypothetical protein
MRVALRSLWVVVLALASTVALAVAWTTATAVQLVATALIMGGTGHPLSTPPDDPLTFIDPYMDNAIMGYINPGAAAGTGTGGAGIAGVGPDDDRYAVITPEQFFPVAGSQTFDDSVAVGRANLNGCIRGTGCDYNTSSLLSPPAPMTAPLPGDEFAIYGYSQSAVIAALVKQDLIDNPEETPTNASFFLLANATRPNGGFLARGPEGLTIPILGVTFYGPAPTNSCDTGQCMPTIDAAGQYDGLGGDAAVSLTNPLAVLNAAAGYLLLHGDLQTRSFDDALYQGSYGDTDYYIIPARRLPILMPFEAFVPSPILTLLEQPIKAAIEAGYRRDINPGVHVPVSLLPFAGNPLQAILNILVAIPTGVDDALAEVTNDPTFRPLGTEPVTSPFGVGGPALPDPPPATTTAIAVSTSPAQDDAPASDLSEADSEDSDSAVRPGELGAASGSAAKGAAGERATQDTTSATRQPTLRGPIEVGSPEQGNALSPAQSTGAEGAPGTPGSTPDGADQAAA